MATGRRDYWYGMLPGLAALGPGQSDWFKKGVYVGNTPGTHEFLSYTVPSGYKLNITGGLISIDHPGIRACFIYVGLDVIFQMFFDQSQTIPFEIGGLRGLVVGDVVKCTMTFSENIDFIMWGMLVGYLEIV